MAGPDDKDDASGMPLVVRGPATAKGGIRSPALGAARPASPQPAPQPAPRPSEASGLSAIKGLDEPQRYDTMATALSHHMFDRGRERRRTSLKVVVILLVVGSVGALVAFPEARRQTARWITKTKNATIALVRPAPKARPKARRVAETADPARPTRPDRPRALAAAAGIDLLKTSKGNCETMTRAVLPQDKRLSVEERVAVADCFLAFDNPQGADEVLRPLKARLRKATEAELNGQREAGSLADALQTAVQASVKMGKTREADELLRGRCVSWQQSNTCVAKLIAHAAGKRGGAALGNLFETRGRLGGKAEARFWQAGAQVAATDGRHSVADQRFAIALASAPKDALPTRKQIYEAQAIDLYWRGEILKLKGVVKAAEADLAKLSPKARIKLQMLGELAGGVGDRRRVVRALLTREDVTFRARGDIELIDILGPEALRHGLADEYMRLVDRTRAHYSERYKASTPVLRRLALWEIRAAMTRKAYDQAAQLLGNFEGRYGADAVTSHLKGIVFLRQDPGPKYALFAATEFQAAVRAKGGWESLYALGVALTRGERLEQVPAVIRDLERLVMTPGQRFWADMLKAEYYTAGEKYVNAVKLLKDWSAKEPGFSVPRQLLVDALRKMGQKTEAEAQERALDDLARGGVTREAFASPLGVLAHERRAID